jgi:uncharacterized membrane protein YfcA
MALLFQNQEPQTARATISASFIIGSVVSLIGLAVAGEITGAQVGGGVALWPFVAAGFVSSRWVIGRVDGAASRRVVLTVAALSGLAAVIKALA